MVLGSVSCPAKYIVLPCEMVIFQGFQLPAEVSSLLLTAFHVIWLSTAYDQGCWESEQGGGKLPQCLKVQEAS